MLSPVDFDLQTNESVQTEDGKLRVRLKGVGRTISESGDSRKTVANFVIELVNADSFDKTNCELKITRRGNH